MIHDIFWLLVAFLLIGGGLVGATVAAINIVFEKADR